MKQNRHEVQNAKSEHDEQKCPKEYNRQKGNDQLKKGFSDYEYSKLP